jgi:phage antirepressor YoqD-like protein
MIFNVFSQDIDVIVGENKFYNFRDAAKLINKKGLGQKGLFKLLREKEVLNQYNEPMGEWENSSFFKVVDNRYATTLISTYGINYIKKHFL